MKIEHEGNNLRVSDIAELNAVNASSFRDEVRAAMPADPESIEIGVAERTLTISGQRGRPRVDGQVYQQAEIEYGRFERRIPLGHDIAAASASAVYEAGMLRITLPVAKRASRGRAVAIVVRR